MAQPIICCRGLGKQYGSVDVLQSVNFDIERGRLIGFLGPNGAGKTTTIRILLGLLKPSSGTTTIFGKSCQSEGKSIRSEIGYLPGDVHLYSNLTGRKMLHFFANARKRDCASEIGRLSDVLQLELDRKIRKYSTGMRQKLGLIQALMHKPDLLVLDEPTSALDPLIRKTVFNELKQVVADGRTVLFSSHSLSEVEELCDEVIILRAGKIVEQAKLEQLQERAFRRVKVVFEGAKATDFETPQAFIVKTRDDVTVVGTWQGKIVDLVHWLNDKPVSDLTIEQPDLNDLFLTYYDGGENNV